MEYKKVTAEIWAIGRERGMSNKEIRKNWKNLWNEVSQKVYSYNKQLDTEALEGIEKIRRELENTIRSFTKTAKTEQAEMNSLDNVMKVVNKAITQAGAIYAFNAFADIYDNGAGEWLQRIIAAIYDTEMAQWSQGMPQYMAKMQSEIIDKISSTTGVTIDTSEIEFDTGFLDEDLEFNGAENYEPMESTSLDNSLNVDDLRKQVYGR